MQCFYLVHRLVCIGSIMRLMNFSFLCMILLYSISSRFLNGRVDGDTDDRDSFEFNKMLLLTIQNKI
jgi:hypothetical protein